MSRTVGLAVSVLAQQPPQDTGPDFGKASPVGLLVVVLLLIGTVLLVWSMNRHLRKLPQSFDGESLEADQVVDDDGAVADKDLSAPKTPHDPDG